MSRKQLTAKPAPTQALPSRFTDVVIRHTSPEGLRALREILLRCPLPGAVQVTERLQAGLRSNICRTPERRTPWN